MECKKENHDSFHIRKRGWKKIQQRVNLISNVISFLSYCVIKSEEKYVNVKIWNDKLTTGHIMWFPWEFTNTHVYSLLERNFVRECFWQDTGKRLNCSGFWGLIWKVTCAWHDTLLILKPLLVESVGYPAYVWNKNTLVFWGIFQAITY